MSRAYLIKFFSGSLHVALRGTGIPCMRTLIM